MKLVFLFILMMVVLIAACEDNRVIDITAPCDPDPHGYRDGFEGRSTCPHHVLADPNYCDMSLCHVGPRESTCNVGRGCHDFFFRYCAPGVPLKDGH